MTLAKIIQEFRPAQDRAVIALRDDLGISLPESNVHWVTLCTDLGLNETRTLGGIPIYVHGYGVELRFPEITIDFDWGDKGEGNGFDAWRLWNHCEENKLFLELPDYSTIQGWLDDSLRNGELVRDRLLFYQVEGHCLQAEQSKPANLFERIWRTPYSMLVNSLFRAHISRVFEEHIGPIPKLDQRNGVRIILGILLVILAVSLWTRVPSKTREVQEVIDQIQVIKKNAGRYPLDLGSLASVKKAQEHFKIYFGNRTNKGLTWSPFKVSENDFSFLSDEDAFLIFMPADTIKSYSFSSFSVYRYGSDTQRWQKGRVHWSWLGTYWDKN